MDSIVTTSNQLDPREIEKEVRRLSPWYYLYDLKGVKTNITPPFDDWGHRSVELPLQFASYIKGKTILDVGCNEGQYSVSALNLGASRVVGFDCRPINIEKARFVARVLALDNITFHTGSADTWPDDRYDVVLLLGLIYHMEEPWRTIRKYCGIARETIYLTSVFYGGEDGYSPVAEWDAIGAAENPSTVAMWPNTSNTIVKEFAQHGFVPVYEHEWSKRTSSITTSANFPNDGGGCSILFVNKGMTG